MSVWLFEPLRHMARAGPLSPLSFQAIHTVVVANRHFFLALVCGPWPWKEAMTVLCCCHLQRLTTWAQLAQHSQGCPILLLFLSQLGNGGLEGTGFLAFPQGGRGKAAATLLF